MARFTVSDQRGPGSRGLTASETANRQLVIDCFTEQFRTRDFEQVRGFFAPDYVDHNVDVPGGDLEGFARYVTAAQAASPEIVIDVRRIVVDGDHVAVHLRGQLSPESPVDNVMEIYRIVEGRIVEHWETVQPIPAESPNPVAGF